MAHFYATWPQLPFADGDVLVMDVYPAEIAEAITTVRLGLCSAHVPSLSALYSVC